MLVAAQTELRASELLGLCGQDVVLGTGAHIRCTGKGRKERCTPLRKDAVVALRAWIKERNAQPSAPLFPNAWGQRLSHDALDYILAKHVATAKNSVPQCRRNGSPRTCSTGPSSRFGWDTNQWRPPRFTSTPIFKSRNRPWQKQTSSSGGWSAIGLKTKLLAFLQGL